MWELLGAGLALLLAYLLGRSRGAHHEHEKQLKARQKRLDNARGWLEDAKAKRLELKHKYEEARRNIEDETNEKLSETEVTREDVEAVIVEIDEARKKEFGK